jgi:hypothetical protein
MLWEKTFPSLNEAMQALISSDTSLSNRLETAILSLSRISENDLPFTIQKEFRHLMASVEAYRDGENHPDLQADLAKDIFTFFKIFMVEGWPPTISLARL